MVFRGEGFTSSRTFAAVWLAVTITWSWYDTTFLLWKIIGNAVEIPNGKPCIVYSNSSRKKFNQSPFRFGVAASRWYGSEAQSCDSVAGRRFLFGFSMPVLQNGLRLCLWWQDSTGYDICVLFFSKFASIPFTLM